MSKATRDERNLDMIEGEGITHPIITILTLPRGDS
jgi:hypothetical protein